MCRETRGRAASKTLPSGRKPVCQYLLTSPRRPKTRRKRRSTSCQTELRSRRVAFTGWGAGRLRGGRGCVCGVPVDNERSRAIGVLLSPFVDPASCFASVRPARSSEVFCGRRRSCGLRTHAVPGNMETRCSIVQEKFQSCVFSLQNVFASREIPSFLVAIHLLDYPRCLMYIPGNILF